MRSAAIIFVIFTVAILSHHVVSAGHVYAVVTGFGGNDTETIQQTVRVDDNNGNIDILVTNLVITGSSLMYDGISTFNDEQGVLYYAPNWPAPYIFPADVSKKALLAPIYVPGEIGVTSLDYDDATGNLLSMVLVKKGKMDDGIIVSMPIRNPGPFKVVAVFSRNETEYVTDAYNDQFFVITKATNATAYTLVTIFLNTNNYTAVDLPCNAPAAVPNYLVYDPNTQTFYIVADAAGGYNLWTINSAGTTCKHTPIPLPKGAIATCFSYDVNNQRIWIGIATNSGGYLYAFSVASGTIYKSIQIPNVPEVIEYAHAH